MATLFSLFPFLLKLYADSGNSGDVFQRGAKKALARFNIEIVKRPDRAKGFIVLPGRWVPGSSSRTSRTIAWLNRCRRLAKDWECLNRKALSFIHLASIRFMLRKLCNPA